MLNKRLAYEHLKNGLHSSLRGNLRLSVNKNDRGRTQGEKIRSSAPVPSGPHILCPGSGGKGDEGKKETTGEAHIGESARLICGPLTGGEKRSHLL